MLSAITATDCPSPACEAALSLAAVVLVVDPMERLLVLLDSHDTGSDILLLNTSGSSVSAPPSPNLLPFSSHNRFTAFAISSCSDLIFAHISSYR
jgi:hypothetical protein